MSYCIRLVLILSFALFSFLPRCYAFDVSFQKGNGLFHVGKETDVLIDASYVGWTSGWKWDAPKIEHGMTQEAEQSFHLTFRRQGVGSHVVLSSDKNHITYNYLIQFNKSLPSTIGGGIEFRLNLSSPRLQGASKEPQLLPENSGWTWEIEPGKSVVVRFSPNVASVYFERGKRSKIRAMFFRKKVSPGTKQIKMQVTFPADTNIADIRKIYAPDDSTSWLTDALKPDQSFIDLSYLNDSTAGQHGFVRAEGERLIFEDGTEALFFGANIQAYSLFIRDKALIKKHAQRLARLGFNLARLHHHDSAKWVRSSLIKEDETTQQIDEAALDSYFWWVKCLRDEGIYIWVDLQVSRPWRKGDKIPGWDSDMAADTKRGMNSSKGFIYLNERMQELTKQFNEALLTRVNPYTRLALKDDPAVMGVLITNENDLTRHFGNAFLKDKGHPYHQALFEKELAAFSKQHGITARKLRKTWQAGPSKLLLNDLEARFNKMMIAHLRSIGVRAPIATTNLWGHNPQFSLPALTTGDMIDTHAYAGQNLLRKNPRYSPNFIHWIGQGQVAGKPMTVSEYNTDEKSVQNEGLIIVPYVAAMAAFQGWDALMLYGYSQDKFRGRKFSPWSSYLNPAIMGLIPAAAMLYREGHVAPAKETYAIRPANNNLFLKDYSPKKSFALRTIMEQHRLVIAMPKSDILKWLEPSKMGDDVIVITDLNNDTLPQSQNDILSDTGEIYRDWRSGVLTIDTPKTQAAIGEIGGEGIDLTDVTMDISTPKASVILTSLDGARLAQSEKILVSTAARVKGVRTGKVFEILSETVSGRVELKSDIKNMSLWPLMKDGSRGEPIPLRYTSNQTYLFDLPTDQESHWFIIEKPKN